VQEATRLEDRKLFQLEKDRKAFRMWLMQHDAERARTEQKKKKKKNISRKSKEFREVALRDLRLGVR